MDISLIYVLLLINSELCRFGTLLTQVTLMRMQEMWKFLLMSSVDGILTFEVFWKIGNNLFVKRGEKHNIIKQNVGYKET